MKKKKKVAKILGNKVSGKNKESGPQPSMWQLMLDSQLGGKLQFNSADRRPRV
jgi:hypothetical protein